MIKALAGNLLILGITEENVRRMRKGEHIKIDLKTMGKPEFTEIGICYAPTDEELMAIFEPYITAHTQVHGSEH